MIRIFLEIMWHEVLQRCPHAVQKNHERFGW